ncbi:hypothetical protein EYS14_18805 [Alteromonadaceae bacterium M269]|nr:hypothetical protein EYS14_18805 [Alteromonadaceae bacterium M269]
MRNLDRIPETLGLIERIWEKDPDLRFNQLIYNLQRGYSQENKDIGKIEEVIDDGFSRVGFDLFNLEDDSFIEYLRKQVANQ